MHVRRVQQRLERIEAQHKTIEYVGKLQTHHGRKYASGPSMLLSEFLRRTGLCTCMPARALKCTHVAQYPIHDFTESVHGRTCEMDVLPLVPSSELTPCRPAWPWSMDQLAAADHIMCRVASTHPCLHAQLCLYEQLCMQGVGDSACFFFCYIAAHVCCTRHLLRACTADTPLPTNLGICWIEHQQKFCEGTA
jgi:hypothetical protein